MDYKASVIFSHMSFIAFKSKLLKNDEFQHDGLLSTTEVKLRVLIILNLQTSKKLLATQIVGFGTSKQMHGTRHGYTTTQTTLIIPNIILSRMKVAKRYKEIWIM